MDAHKNFAASLVATAPSPATSGTSLVVTTGEGTKFPAAPFNAVIYPAGSIPTAANAEIVRVTIVATDTLTITRTQESTSARTVVIGDAIVAAITAKTMTDVENALVPAYVALTPGSTVTWTVVAGQTIQNATLAMGGNYALVFSGLTSGMTGTLIPKQDGTGSRTLTLPSSSPVSKVVGAGAGAVTLTAAANAIDILTWTYDGTNMYWTYGPNFT